MFERPRRWWQITLGAVLAACSAPVSSDFAVSRPPSAPSAPVGVGRQGVQGCPTVSLDDLDLETTKAPAGLSETFSLTCGACHGADGTGRGPAPAIAGRSDFEEIEWVVRHGKGAMRAFSEAEVDGTVLRRDLILLASAASAEAGMASAWRRWSPEQTTAAYDRGLAAWRRGYEQGTACASCHAPDAIDVALLGFSDADIARRALRLVDPTTVRDVLDLVHAQRKKHDLIALCDPAAWRPFQPAGHVVGDLALVEQSARPPQEDTPEQRVQRSEAVARRDDAFLVSLADYPFSLVTGNVFTFAEAVRAKDEILALNLRELPLGIPFARYSEDAFHGLEHASVNDWITDRGLAPSPGREHEWLQAQDEYLQDSTDDAFGRLMQLARETLQTDPVFRSYGDALKPTGERNARNKYFSTLVASHAYRSELQGQLWTQRPARAFTGEDTSRHVGNPFFSLGSASDIDNSYLKCEKGVNCMGFAPTAAAEMLPNQAFSLLSMAQWWTLGFYLDHAIVEPGYDPVDHYWAGHAFVLPGYLNHGVVLMTIKFVYQNEHASTLRQIEQRFPILSGTVRGDEQWFGWGYFRPPLSFQKEESAWRRYTHTAANAMRMMMLLYAPKLRAAVAVTSRNDIVKKLREWEMLLHVYDPDHDALHQALLSELRAALAQLPELKPLALAAGTFRWCSPRGFLSPSVVRKRGGSLARPIWIS